MRVYRDKVNSEIVFGDKIAACWCKRSGNDFVFQPTCMPVWGHPDMLHMRGFYVQIFNYGGHFVWRSDKCYEEEK